MKHIGLADHKYWIWGLLGMLNIVGTIQKTTYYRFQRSLLGMLNIVGTIHILVATTDILCLLGMLNIVGTIL